MSWGCCITKLTHLISYIRSYFQPQETMFQPFADFCQSMSIPILIVPAGFDLKPPQINSCDGEEEEDVVDSSISTGEEDDDSES